MAAPTDTPLTGEIWHLSVDDLLAPLPEVARLGGQGPFVINLSASTAPITLPAKGITGCEQAHMYQLQRTEDRRPRYRLRLGPFDGEDEADAILKIVRDIYPGALTATADADDLRAIATLCAKIGALPSPKEKPPASIDKPTPSIEAPAEKPAAVPVSLPPAPQAVPSRPAAKPTVSAVPMAPAVPTLSVMPAAPAKPMAPAVPTLSVTPTVLAMPKISSMPTAERKVPVRVPAGIPTLNAPAPRHAEQLNKCVPSLDATQTVRALTQPELEDDAASRWFVIQLSLAEDAFDPDTLPNLDIFSVYRLYSVAGIDQGRIMHALRLGFFTEEISAGAVASYLAAFYDKPTVKRVSSAERERFAEQSLEPRKDVGATGKHAAIEITSERFVRERRSGQGGAK
jgi:hypothetical protein